jgi:formylmethanofuran dehydrogenase subunit E
MEDFEDLLAKSVKTHGHLCPGQVLGVRMSILGLRLIGIIDPRGEDRKHLYVIVEIDRCATDAIQSVTGCSLGKRTLRWLDHGIMAATFVNLATGRAVRIVGLEESRTRALTYCTTPESKYERQIAAYKIMPDEELFAIQQVTVDIPPERLPGKPLQRVQCQQCGEWVQDRREVLRDGIPLCRNCGDPRYFTVNELLNNI